MAEQSGMRGEAPRKASAETDQPSLFALAEHSQSHRAGQKSGPSDTASRLKLQADSPKQTRRKVVSLH